jgi:hypothetical protein
MTPDEREGSPDPIWTIDKPLISGRALSLAMTVLLTGREGQIPARLFLPSITHAYSVSAMGSAF